jgi:aldose sugar dehydrogenase
VPPLMLNTPSSMRLPRANQRRSIYSLLPAVTVLCLSSSAGCSAQVDEVPAQVLSSSNAEAETVEHRVVTVVEGLEHPWGMAFLPGGEGVLVTERPGRMRLVREGRLVAEPIGGLPQVRAEGESGLLDVAIHPAFQENRLVYFSYAKPGRQGSTTAVGRGRLEGGRLTGVEDVFIADAWGPAAVNHGGRIVFDGDGHLLVTVGDRREEERAQELADHVGTTVRLHDDGRVPSDNPFVGRPDARSEIYTYGHRNGLGLAVHPETGEIWQSENGALGGDEVNRLRAGGNYGWPIASFGTHYDGRGIPDPRSGDGLEAPVHYWVPGISPSGLMIYAGDAFPEWRGDLFNGSLQARHLNRIEMEGERVATEERLLEGRGQRIRAVESGPDGLIYLLVDGPSAPLLRVEPGR